MNLTELKSALDAAGIAERAYSFTVKGGDEVYQIAPFNDQLGDGWEVYYSERGNKNDLIIFRSEAEACDQFLKWVLADKSTRLPLFHGDASSP